MLFIIAMALATDPVLNLGSYYNFYDTIGSVFTLGISILGLYYCFKINAGGDNKDFILRVICLGLPVTIRVTITMIPVFIVVGILDIVYLSGESLNEESIGSTPMQVVLMSVFTAGHFWYLSLKIKAVSLVNG